MQPGLILKKTHFFIFFFNWEKLRSPAKATLKNLKIFLLIGKNLEVPKISTKNSNFESMNDLGMFDS